jgi:hypothetical protein
MAWTVGCGGTDPAKPPLGKVHGYVTYGGKPVTSGSVIFTPVAGTGGGTGQVATGQLGSDGSYSLTTFDEGDGAILGQHAVTVDAREGNATELNLAGTEGAKRNPGGAGKRGGRSGAVGKIPYIEPKSLVPKKYLDPATTPFRRTVEAGSNKIDLELVD